MRRRTFLAMLASATAAAFVPTQARPEYSNCATNALINEPPLVNAYGNGIRGLAYVVDSRGWYPPLYRDDFMRVTDFKVSRIGIGRITVDRLPSYAKSGDAIAML